LRVGNKRVNTVSAVNAGIFKSLNRLEIMIFPPRPVLNTVQQGHRQLVLDFSQVDFIDSSCLGALISILKSLSQGGQLILCALNDNIKNMFTLTRMDRVFTLAPTARTR